MSYTKTKINAITMNSCLGQTLLGIPEIDIAIYDNFTFDASLNIDDIIIDDISLGNLLWSAEYILDNPQRYNDQTITKLDNCVNLGWNGTYVLKLTSPFYIWLLEKL